MRVYMYLGGGHADQRDPSTDAVQAVSRNGDANVCMHAGAPVCGLFQTVSSFIGALIVTRCAGLLPVPCKQCQPLVCDMPRACGHACTHARERAYACAPRTTNVESSPPAVSFPRAAGGCHWSVQVSCPPAAYIPCTFRYQSFMQPACMSLLCMSVSCGCWRACQSRSWGEAFPPDAPVSVCTVLDKGRRCPCPTCSPVVQTWRRARLSEGLAHSEEVAKSRIIGRRAPHSFAHYKAVHGRGPDHQSVSHNPMRVFRGRCYPFPACSPEERISLMGKSRTKTLQCLSHPRLQAS